MEHKTKLFALHEYVRVHFVDHRSDLNQVKTRKTSSETPASKRSPTK